MSVAQAKQDFSEQPLVFEVCNVHADRSPPRPVLIRRYQDSDRKAVRWLCCETGFLGNPIDPIYRDRELFADLITNPYLDHEPEWALIAACDNHVVGYLLGSVNPHFSRTLILSGFQTACKMLTRLLTGKYQDHPRSELFVRWVLTKGLMEQPNHPEDAAHLHLNLEKWFRRGVLARRLWSIYEDLLQAASIRHYYAQFFSCAQRNPEPMYVRCGFKLYDRSDTTMFQPEISTPVAIVCAHKILGVPVFRRPPLLRAAGGPLCRPEPGPVHRAGCGDRCPRELGRFPAA
jgi:hypothetical protein